LIKLAIFSAPKPFSDPHISVIQKNAILSWKALGNSIEVWLVGNEEGVDLAAQDLEVNYIAEVDRNLSGTPRIDSIFGQVRKASSAEYLCYVNADILLFPDLLDTLEVVGHSTQRFLLVGQRWDMEIKEPLPIKPGWSSSFMERMKHNMKLHVPSGSDYFVFPRTLFTDIPAFAVGRAGWDNWMIYHGRRENLAVIDATRSITVVHQNHDFKHLTGGRIHRKQPESLENLNLAGGRQTMFTLANTNKRIIQGKITNPELTGDYISREISIFPLLHIRSNWLGKVIYTILNPRRVAKENERDRKMKENITKTTGGKVK
jgi:hypothetical protein